MASANDLPQSTVEWLALIRYQLLMASEQSKLGAPLCGFALNTMHDAVESALSLVVQSKGGSVNNRLDFLQAFDAAVAHGADPQILTAFRAAMSAMNTARVSFKHHGNVPDESIIHRHLGRVEEFVAALVHEVFDIELADVSVLVFLKSAEARNFLLKAQEAWNEGRSAEAMEYLRLSFDGMIKDYTGRKQWHPGKGLFTTKPSFYPSVFDFNEYGKTIKKLDEWLQNLDKWVRYSALGVDMRRFAYFDAHAPTIQYAVGGNHFTHAREGIEMTNEVFTRCFKFVVDTGISLSRDDFDFDLWSARRASQPPDDVS
jgi:hypothetical protein